MTPAYKNYNKYAAEERRLAILTEQEKKKNYICQRETVVWKIKSDTVETLKGDSRKGDMTAKPGLEPPSAI